MNQFSIMRDTEGKIATISIESCIEKPVLSIRRNRKDARENIPSIRSISWWIMRIAIAKLRMDVLLYRSMPCTTYPNLTVQSNRPQILEQTWWILIYYSKRAWENKYSFWGVRYFTFNNKYAIMRMEYLDGSKGEFLRVIHTEIRFMVLSKWVIWKIK